MYLGDPEVLTAWSGVEPWEEALSEAALMYYFETKPLFTSRPAPSWRCQGGPDRPVRLQGCRTTIFSKKEDFYSRPQYSPRCYQARLQTIRILQGKCHSSHRAENLTKIDRDCTADKIEESSRKVVGGSSKAPAVPFNDGLWSVLLMDPACVRFLDRLTGSMHPKSSARSDQSGKTGIDEPGPGLALKSARQMEPAKEFKPGSDDNIPKTSSQNDPLPRQAEAFSADAVAIPNPSVDTKAVSKPERLDTLEGIGSAVNGQILEKDQLGQALTPEEAVRTDAIDLDTPLSEVQKSLDASNIWTDAARELGSASLQSASSGPEVPEMAEPTQSLLTNAFKEPRNSIEFADRESDSPIPQASETTLEPENNEDSAVATVDKDSSSDKADSSLRRVGVFVAAVACAVVSVFDPSRVNFVESAPANKSSRGPPSTKLTNSEGGATKASSSTKGQGSTSSGSDSRDASTAASSSGGIGGGIGSGGNSGGGGGGSDGDDNWGRLPDEPSDGFGAPDPRGITIVVAAISLIGATLVHFFRRGKSNRQEEVATVEEVEEIKTEEAEESIHNDLRGTGNTSIEIAEPLRDLRDKQVALCVTPVTQEQILPVRVDPTSCTVVSPSPTVHNEPECESPEFEQLDVKHSTSRGISLAEIARPSSDVDYQEDGHLEKTHGSSETLKSKPGLDSSDQPSNNEDLKAENAELLATVSNLMEKLRRADARRKDATDELAYRRASFSTSEADLKGRLLGQEEQNTQIQRRFSEVDQERLSLVSTVKDAQAALSAVHPRLSQTLEEIERLSKVMRDQRKELSRLKLELGNATHDQGVVHRKMQSKEWEMEEINQLIGTMEKIETSLSGNEHGKGFEDILNQISNGMKALRGLEKRSKTARQIAASFQGVLLKLRDYIFNSYNGAEQSEQTASLLKAADDEKKQLQDELDEVRKNSRDLITERDVLKTSVQMLKNSFQEKTLILEEIKLKQDSSEAIILRGENERKRLMSELEDTRSELRDALNTIDEAQRRSDDINAQVDVLKEEKRSLQTQLKGLRLRIEQFEVEAQRLHSESEGLRTSLHQETTKGEELELLSQELRQSHSQMLSDHKKQVESLQEGLIAAELKITELREDQANIEAAKKELRDAYDIETQDLKSQIQHLQDQAIEVARQNAQVSGAEELTRIMESAKEKGLKVETGASAASYTSYTRAPAHEHPAADPMDRNDSMVLAWMENAAADHPNPGAGSSVQGGAKQMDPALMTGTTEEIIPQKHPPRERRASWPQDMSTMISDHMFGAAQEVVQLTGASLEISREKEAVASELKEANAKISETVAKLEEKDAAMCDLTEHFLQVYQIASNLSTEKESTELEIKEAMILSENLRVQIHQKDERISELEGYFNSRLLAHRVEMDAEQEIHTDLDFSMATPRSVTSVGTRSRSALPRAPSRAMSATSRVPSYDPVSTHRRPNSPSPTSVSHIPEAPSSDASFRQMPRQSDSFEQSTSLPESHAMEQESKEHHVAQPKATQGYSKSRTSLKRISSAASIRNRSGGFQ